MKKWVKENMKTSDKRKLAKARIEARSRANEEEKKEEHEEVVSAVTQVDNSVGN